MKTTDEVAPDTSHAPAFEPSGLLADLERDQRHSTFRVWDEKRERREWGRNSQASLHCTHRASMIDLMDPSRLLVISLGMGAD